MTALATTTLVPTVGSIRALGAYLTFDLRRAIRNRRYAMFAIGFPVIFYLLYTGILLGGAKPDPAWNAYYMVSMMAYGMIGAALSTAIPISQERATGWTRQLRLTPLPAAAWVATKLAVAYVTSLPALVLVGSAAFFVNHVDLPATTWIAILLSLAIGVIPFVGLGLLFGFVLDASAAQGAVTISYIGLAILGGLWAPVSTFPDTLATIAHVLPTFHFANLAWASLSTGLPDPVDALVVAAYAVAIFALVAWRYRVSEQRVRG
jgi:ABC-2 type transport system permease protein